MINRASCILRSKRSEKHHVSSIAGVTEVTEVAKRSVLNRLWLALCNVYVCVERSFVKFVYTIYRNDMGFFLTPYTSKNQVARGMFAFIESNKSISYPKLS